MGLDFKNSNAHWSYGGFNRFREKIAKKIGVDLREMDGFKTSDGKNFGEQIEGKSWRGVKDDLKYLLNHSDCGGSLTSKVCFKVAKRLKEIIKSWSEDDYDRQQAEELIKTMEICAENNKRLYFC